MPTSGEIPDFIYEIPEPPEMSLLDNNISTIAANIAGPSMPFIPHQAPSGRKQMQDAIANDGEVLDPAKGQEKGKDVGNVLLINVQEGCQETTAQMHVHHATEKIAKGKIADIPVFHVRN